MVGSEMAVPAAPARFRVGEERDMKSTQVVALAMVCTASVSAHAVITSYSTRATFNAAAGALNLQDFESYTPATNIFLGTPYDFGDFSALNDANTGGGTIRFPGLVNGSIEIEGSIRIGGAEFHLTFDYPITAIGFDADNLADQRFDDLIFNNSSGDVVGIHDSADRVRFWGFISDTPFTDLTIRQTGFGSGGGTTDGFRFDDMAYSAPAPGAAVVGLMAWACHRRRRRA